MPELRGFSSSSTSPNCGYSNYKPTKWSHGRLRWMTKAAVLLLGSFGVLNGNAYDPNDPCAHERDANVGGVTNVPEGGTVYSEINMNQTQRFHFLTRNTTLMHQHDDYRKLIINLEPCKGVVYLFVRKTRRCFPNPYSCIKLTEGQSVLSSPDQCEWTHFMSVIDGTRDGAPTFFEMPLTSTKYFISVFGREKSTYTITFLTDIGAFPRPGRDGTLSATQLQELQIQLGWEVAEFVPQGITSVKQYWVYSALLLDGDERTNAAVFISKNKVMNTVCGLKNNTDKPASTPIPASRCNAGRCNATIDGVITGKKYVFNVVAESERGFNMTYAGLILSTEWQVVRKAASEKTLQVVGAVTGAVLGMVIIIYVWMVNLYGK